MNIKKVNKARKIIEKAKEELSVNVKIFLERGDFKVYVQDDIKYNYEINSFALKFITKQGIEVFVNFSRYDVSNNFYYFISCSEISLYRYEPPMKDHLTAQGTINVISKNHVGNDIIEVSIPLELQKHYS